MPFVAHDGTSQYIIWPNGTKTQLTNPNDGTQLTSVLGWKYVELAPGTLAAIPNS